MVSTTHFILLLGTKKPNCVMSEVFGFVSSVLEFLPGIRGLLGFILVFFLPGFVWTLVFFRQINVIERIALSFGLSIAVVTLSLLALNKLIGISITAFNSVLIIIAVTIAPVAFYYLNRLIRSRLSRKT